MAKIVPLNGARPAGWNKDRWRWVGLVRRDPDLLPIAKIIAHALAEGFANSETAECHPGYAAIERDCAASKSTVKRALRKLEEGGWIVRLGGEGPGKKAAIRFTFPDQKTAERGSCADLERGSCVTHERGSSVNATGVKSDAPPNPPIWNNQI